MGVRRGRGERAGMMVGMVVGGGVGEGALVGGEGIEGVEGLEEGSEEEAAMVGGGRLFICFVVRLVAWRSGFLR